MYWGGVMRAVTSFSLICLLLIAPSIANADPKTDVAAYEKAFENGDEVNGAKLLKDALNNASSLPVGSAYLAKIAYDNALYFSQINDYKTAFNAIEYTNRAFNSNASLSSSADMDSFNLLYSWLKYRSAPESKDKEKTIRIIDLNSKKLDGKKLNDNILLRANSDLLDYYMFKLNFADASDVLSRQERAIQNTTDVTPEDSKFINSDIALRRGQLLFLKASSKFTSDHSLTKIDRNKNIDWVTSYKEVLKARILYGKPESYEDAIAANIDGWIGLIESFAYSFNTEKKVKEKIYFAQKDVGYKYDELRPKSFKKECLDAFSFDENFATRDRLADNAFFGTATILYDVDEKYNPTNLRVVNSYPDIDFAKNVAENLLTKKIKVNQDNVPKYCYKNNVYKVNFYTDLSFPQ